MSPVPNGGAGTRFEQSRGIPVPRPLAPVSDLIQRDRLLEFGPPGHAVSFLCVRVQVRDYSYIKGLELAVEKTVAARDNVEGRWRIRAVEHGIGMPRRILFNAPIDQFDALDPGLLRIARRTSEPA